MSKRNQDSAAAGSAPAQSTEAGIPQQEAQASAWQPHEEIPQAGGSYVRQSDGSLVKASEYEGNA